MGRMKKGDLESGMRYIVCPEKICEIFQGDYNFYPACITDCPMKDKMTQIWKCFQCEEIVEDARLSFFQTLGHICPDGRTPTQFAIRKYKRIFEIPQK